MTSDFGRSSLEHPKVIALVKARDEAISDAMGDVLDLFRVAMTPVIFTKQT